MTELSKAHVTRRTQHVTVETDWNDIEALKLEVLKLRDELIGAVAREGEVKAQLAALLNKDRLELQHTAFNNHHNILAINASLEDQLDALLQSRTWRIGRMIMKPAGKARKVIKSRGKK